VFIYKILNTKYYYYRRDEKFWRYKTVVPSVVVFTSSGTFQRLCILGQHGAIEIGFIIIIIIIIIIIMNENVNNISA